MYVWVCQVKNAMLAGAKGIVLYSDPADYCAEGVKPYPEGWNLPGGGAQRGNVLNLNGAGDPLTPGYPAKGAIISSSDTFPHKYTKYSGFVLY